MMWNEENDAAVIDSTDIDENIDLEEPKDCVLIGINDNTTTYEFVILMATEVCHRSQEEAVNIAVEVDTKGQSIMWKGTRDLCETKSGEISKYGTSLGYPFKTVVEEA